jgi:pimeloyl-ACP methyl ester carboxylesterase
MESPVRYARSGGVHIAYRTFGEGPRDIVLVPGTVSHVELYWELPTNTYLLKRLASFARVIVFDKRGQGLSDRVAEMTLEERITDVRAVMDAAGSERATIYGWSEGGPMSLMFAATYPERTTGLVLYGSYPSIKVGREDFEKFLETLETHWGEGVLVDVTAPSRREDQSFVQWFGRLERAVASPGGILTLMRANYEIDVRHLLPAIHVPALILHRKGDPLVPVGAGRYLAEHIPGAKYVELPGVDHLLQALDQDLLDVLLDEVEEFITGTRRRPEADRVLATVMFVDMVASTERAAVLGDRRWLTLLQGYRSVVRREVSAFRGREVNTAGDGLVAAFDGPARAVRCARSVRDRVRPLGVEVRIGLHTGEFELLRDRLGGIALHIGARVATTAGPGEILVSSTVRDLVAGSGLRFADRGLHDLKGVPGEWRLFAAE